MPNDDVDMKALEKLALSLYRERSDFLQTLVDLRKEQKLTQAEVAERMGVTQPTVSEFERYDANPRLDTIIRYALAVEAQLDLRAYEAAAFRSTWSHPMPGASRVHEAVRGDDSGRGNRLGKVHVWAA